MNKKFTVFILILLVVGTASVFAAGFRTGTYAIPSTDVTMRFTGNSTGGRVILSVGGSTWNGGSYSVEGERLIIRLERTTDRLFSDLSGGNYVLRIASGGDIYDGSAQWVRVGS
jgi:hypothetical protein